MSSRLRTGLVLTACGGLLAIACSGTITDDVFVGSVGAPPAFIDTSDASADAAPRDLTLYCPSNQCPTGLTTCPTSKFLCDVDLRSDVNNCGACGAACPRKTEDETFSCINGQCVLSCENKIRQDCDGLPDTGCETLLHSNEQCGACGKKCPDPETAPCISELDYFNPQCGCPAPYSYCNPDIYGAGDKCRKLKQDDRNCGACGAVTNPEGPPGARPAPAHAHYGCVEGKPDKLKCDDGWSDCNADLHEEDSDGCEVELGTDQNCTQCGEDCLAQGRFCAYDLPKEYVKACRCPDGQNFCGMFGMRPYGSCADLRSDPNNCGACGVICPGSTSRSRAVCDHGSCKLACGLRWADCNGNVDDDCETDIFSDPQNCGGCGISCDVAAGQACAGGRCVVEPCKEGQESR